MLLLCLLLVLLFMLLLLVLTLLFGLLLTLLISLLLALLLCLLLLALLIGLLLTLLLHPVSIRLIGLFNFRTIIRLRNIWLITLWTTIWLSSIRPVVIYRIHTYNFVVG